MLKLYHRVLNKLTNTPFCRSPLASSSRYKELYYAVRTKTYPDIDALETHFQHKVCKNWLDELALQTQIVIKQSALNYQHGRVLYSALAQYLQSHTGGYIRVFETGTARGFSAVCMAKALNDFDSNGYILTVDIVPHNRKIYWNCIADAAGKHTREELLINYPDELDRIVFIQAKTVKAMNFIGLNRINFAFLDAQHTHSAVIDEYDFVQSRQHIGDMIVFDDVTPGKFDGVVSAVNDIKDGGKYDVTILYSGEERGYAIAKRIQ